MSKTKLYYPLEVCTHVSQVVKKYAFTISEMAKLSENLLPKEVKRDIVQIVRMRNLFNDKEMNIQKFEDLTPDDINNLDFFATVTAWSENRQVFKADADFTQVLIDTEGIHISKDMWNYLPCTAMYIDFSDVPFVVNEFGFSGAFVKIVKDVDKDSWELHIFRMLENMYLPNALFISNKDQDFNINESVELLKFDMIEKEYGAEKAKQAKYNTQSLLLIMQMLCYLSSVEPDVKENELTKQTYRPRKAGQPVKNKFSEIQKHDVGVRYGTAVRKYKASQASASSGTTHKTGHTKRPHFRKAHWSFYWYNVLDDNGETVYNVYGVPEKVKRPKWLAETFVNKDYGEQDVVIHKVTE